MPENHSDNSVTEVSSADELSYRLKQQKALADFSAFVVEMPGTEAMFREACQVTTKALNVEHSKVLRYREKENDLLVIEGVGWKKGVVGNVALSADNGSPAGYAFSNQTAVLSTDLNEEDRFRRPKLLQEHGIRQAINVGLERGGEMFGVLEADSTSATHFTEPDFAFLRSLSNILSAAILRQQAEDGLEAAREQERLLSSELQHRVKNLFSVVAALLSISEKEAREAGEPESAIRLARERVLAMARAGERTIGDGTGEAGVVVENLLEAVLDPYGDRIHVNGTQPPLLVATSTALALVLHELATNSVKYGALGTSKGVVEVDWKREGDRVELHWREREGPPIEKPPKRKGFGRRLIDGVLQNIQGTIDRNWERTGLKVIVSFPLIQND